MRSDSLVLGILTEVVGLDPDRLYPSVFESDDEAFDIWNKEMGIPAERISALAERITSGSMALVRAVRVLRFTMTAVRNTAAANRDAR